MSAIRINVKQARHDVESGEALLVCAYESRKKCDENQIDGAISLDRLKQMESALSKQRELIFFCG